MAILLNPHLSAVNDRLTSVTLAQLIAESPVAAKAGAVRQVTDYGGTIAVSDGVRWRLERLYTTWVNKPEASLVPAGTDLRVTDLNNAIFISDGTNWLPRGVQNLYHKNSLLAAPLTTLSGVTAGLFAIPECKIPAGLLIPNSKLVIQVTARKTTGIAVATASVYLGSAKNSSDQIICGVSMGSGASTDLAINSAAKVSSKTAFLTQTWFGEGSTTGSSSSLQADRGGGTFNADNDMYVSIGISSASESDTFILTSLRVSIEG